MTALGIGLGLQFRYGATAVSGAVLLADTSAPGSPDDNVLSIDFVSSGNPSAYVNSTSAADVFLAENQINVLSIDFVSGGNPSTYVDGTSGVDVFLAANGISEPYLMIDFTEPYNAGPSAKTEDV